MENAHLEAKKITALYRSAAKAGTTFQGKCKALGEYMSEFHNPNENFKDEYQRLMAEAKKIAADAKLAEHRNTWQATGEHLLIAMAPNTEVGITTGRGDKKVIEFIAAEKCKTAKQTQGAAKQIREDNGFAKAGSGKKAAAPAIVSPAEHAAMVLEWFNNPADRAAMVKAFKTIGVSIVIHKKKKAPVAAPADTAATA